MKWLVIAICLVGAALMAINGPTFVTDMPHTTRGPSMPSYHGLKSEEEQ